MLAPRVRCAVSRSSPHLQYLVRTFPKAPILAAVACMSPAVPTAHFPPLLLWEGQLCENKQLVSVSWGPLCPGGGPCFSLFVPSSGIICLALPLQKKVDPTLLVAARPSGPMQRVLVKRLQRQRQLAQTRLEDARRWSSELR